MGPVFQSVQTDVAGGVHIGTGWVDHHGDGRTDVTARTGHWVGLMKPDAHWDIILTSCRQHMTAQSQQNQTDPDQTDPHRSDQSNPDQTRWTQIDQARSIQWDTILNSCEASDSQKEVLQNHNPDQGILC